MKIQSFCNNNKQFLQQQQFQTHFTIIPNFQTFFHIIQNQEQNQ